MAARHKRLITQLGLLATLLGMWEMVAATGHIDPFFFPRPSEIASRVAEWVVDADLYEHFAITLFETLMGYGIGTFLGITTGVFLALSPRIAEVLDPFIKALNAVPRVVLAPLFVLWFGLGVWSKVALAVTLVFFVTFFNAYQGVKQVNPVIVNNARILGAGQRSLLRHVYLPAAESWILSSLRASVGFAIIGAIIGEYLGSSAGLGHVIAQAEGLFDATGVFAGIVVLAAFVLVLDRLLDLVEHRLIAWRPNAVADDR